MSDRCWCGGDVESRTVAFGENLRVCRDSTFHDPDADGRPTVVRKLYLAGPMSGYADSNYPAFYAADVDLRKLNFEVVNPAKTAPKPKCSYTDLLREDLRGLLDCDGVATLDRWWESVGARNEVTVAGVLRMPVRSVKEWIQR